MTIDTFNEDTFNESDHIPSGFLSNILSEDAEFIRRAAKETGFKITVHASSVPGDVSVWTSEPIKRDHSPFWQAYRRLKEAAKGGK